jgi:nicotinamide riboside transporter PnuC
MSNVMTTLIIILCNWLIWRKTRQNTMPTQQKSVEISRQVGRALLIQAVIPIVLQMLPIVFLAVTLLVGQEFSSISFLYVQAWTSCIYPVATMTIVGHYRRQIKKILVCWKSTANSVYPSTE